MKITRAFLILILSLNCTVFAEEPKPSQEREELIRSVTKNVGAGVPIELKTLEIRAKLYEPQIVYVLDRAKIDIDFLEEEVKFTSRITEPILDNQF